MIGAIEIIGTEIGDLETMTGSTGIEIVTITEERGAIEAKEAIEETVAIVETVVIELKEIVATDPIVRKDQITTETAEITEMTTGTEGIPSPAETTAPDLDLKVRTQREKEMRVSARRSCARPPRREEP